MSQKSKLNEKLRWAKEAYAYVSDQMENHANIYFNSQNELAPAEYEHYFEMDKEALKRKVKRLERDIEDFERGEFKKASEIKESDEE